MGRKRYTLGCGRSSVPVNKGQGRNRAHKTVTPVRPWAGFCGLVDRVSPSFKSDFRLIFAVQETLGTGSRSRRRFWAQSRRGPDRLVKGAHCVDTAGGRRSGWSGRMRTGHGSPWHKEGRDWLTSGLMVVWSLRWDCDSGSQKPLFGTSRGRRGDIGTKRSGPHRRDGRRARGGGQVRPRMAVGGTSFPRPARGGHGAGGGHSSIVLPFPFGMVGGPGPLG